jgi:hypothetical protein
MRILKSEIPQLAETLIDAFLDSNKGTRAMEVKQAKGVSTMPSSTFAHFLPGFMF